MRIAFSILLVSVMSCTVAMAQDRRSVEDTVRALDDEERVARWRTPAEDVPSSHTVQLGAVLDAYERGERPPGSGQEARRTIELATPRRSNRPNTLAMLNPSPTTNSTRAMRP